MKLAGKTVVVTGAAGGIGLCTARACLAAGARVHLTDLDPAVVARAAELGAMARGHAHDVRDPAAWDALAEAVRADSGPADVLINNAGVCIGGPSDELPLAAWQQSLDVNLWGPIHGLRAFLPDMLARGRGAIVNVASVAGLMGFPMMGPYCASKSALLGLSEALAVELAGRGIQVCTVCPGAVRTQLLAKSPIQLPGKARAVIERLVERLATPPEKLAAEIVAAIEDGRPLLVAAGSMWPLYALHRAAPGLYGRLFRAATGLATRGGR